MTAKNNQKPLGESFEEEAAADKGFTDEVQEQSNLSFEELLPSSNITFTLPDGRIIPFKEQVTMNRDDFSNIASLQKRMGRYLEQVEKHPEDEAAKRNLERCATAFIKTVLPDIPPEYLDSLVMGQKTKLVQWWGEQTKISGDSEAKN